MAYTATQERCSVAHMADIDVADHLARYAFAVPYCVNRRVLDIACGTGYGSAELAKVAVSVTGVDVSFEAVDFARQTYAGPDFVVGSMLDFQAPRFDTIVSFETIEHIDDYHAALVNLRRLLAPTGTLVLSTPNRPVNSPSCHTLSDKPRNAFHVREFAIPEMVAAVCEAGFHDVAVYGQKQRRVIDGPLRYVYGALAIAKMLPGHLQADVLPLKRGLQPRYMVLVAH